MDWFECLPKEIWSRIMEFTATSSKTLLSLKLVCKKFKVLVEKVYDHNEPSGKHFRWNIECGHKQEVARLLQDERILIGMNRFQYFYYLCAFGELRMVKSVIDDHRIDPNIGPKHPILAAYLYAQKDIMDFLINHLKVNLQSNLNRIYGSTILTSGYADLMERISLDERVNLDEDHIYFPACIAIESNRPLWLARLFGKYAHIYTDQIILGLITGASQCSQQVLDLLLNHTLVESAEMPMKRKIYKVCITRGVELGCLSLVEKVLAKGIALGEVNLQHVDGTIDPKILSLLCSQSSNLTLINYCHLLVLFDDEEVIRVGLNCSDHAFHMKLFREAILKRRGKVATLVTGGDLNLGRNVNFRDHNFNNIFAGLKETEIKFAFYELGITLSRTQYMSALISSIEYEKGAILELLLSDEKILAQLPLDFIRNQLLPSLYVSKQTKMIEIISKFIK